MAPAARPPSVLFYCHDTYGIGHLKRAFKLARFLSLRWPGMTQLIVTSSASVLTDAVGDGIDYVKLPSVRRLPSSTGELLYVPRVLPISRYRARLPAKRSRASAKSPRPMASSPRPSSTEATVGRSPRARKVTRQDS